MRRWTIAAVILAWFLSFSACGGPSTPSSPTQPSSSTMSAVARAYLDAMLDIMQANSINRRTIDWTTFRSSVVQAGGAAQTVQSVVASDAIGTALRLLADHHSFFMRADGTYVYNPVPIGGCSDRAPASVSVPDTIGYVKVGAFGGSGDAANQFALGVQQQISTADRETLVGWVVDTRGNGGGNMYPMIAGVGSVLGEGPAGAFIEPDGNVIRWGYAAGSVWYATQGNPAISVTPYRLIRPNPRVAVLTDCGVASSGEAVVVAFRGRPDTRSFGKPTYGLSTANRGYVLSDGSTLYLAVSTMADRNLTPYGQAIVPDEVIADPEATLARAVEWLRGR